jgi:hypothetical protein
MSRRILALAVFSTLALSAAACSSPLESLPGQVSATQSAGSAVAPGDSLPWVYGGSDDPATHDVGDDRGGVRGDSASGRGGADDPANHQ